jgi:hypothetical protein
MATLETLIAHDGQMPPCDFCRHFGPLRPYRPCRKEHQEAPWLDPSPTERVCYWGLAFPISLGNRDALLIPRGLLSFLPKVDLTLQLQAIPKSVASEQAFIRNVFTLLSFLNHQDTRPLWRPWLTLKPMRELDRRLLTLEPPEGVRSERQTDDCASSTISARGRA